MTTAIVGGGIMGATTLWELARAGEVATLYESGDFGRESTGKSAAIVRAHYSNPEVVRMAVRSREAFSSLPDLLGCEPVYRRTGWMFVVDEEDAPLAEQNRAMQEAEGSHSVEVPLEELARHLPGIALEGIAYALFEEESGFADPIETTAAYVEAARRLGATAFERSRVERIVVERDRVRGVRVGGRLVECDTVVLAAGAWSRALAAGVGVDLPIEVTREQDVIYDTGSEPPPPLAVSLQVDRIYLRPLLERDGSLLLVGRGFPKPYDHVQPGGYDDRVDDEFEADARARVSRRFPRLEGVRFDHGRVGLYSVTPDWHPILGPVEGIEGLHVATGGSGHCFKLGPAIGELVAAGILGREVDYADVGRFALGRFAAGELFVSTYGGNRA